MQPSTKGGVATVHIEFFQRPTENNFSVFTTPWDARGLYSTGMVTSADTATWLMAGASQASSYWISASTRVPNAPPCTMLSSGWCKFPYCGVPEPKWPPWSPAKPASGHSGRTDGCPTPLPTAPVFPSTVPPFPSTWDLRSSTIIHTSNKSGWTDPAEASKFGIISFDWNNAKNVWMRPADKNSSSCEAALLEQARRVKAIATTGSRVLVYRNVMWALQWMESERDVMYSGRHDGFFLRHKSSGAVWRKDLGDGAGEGFLVK